MGNKSDKNLDRDAIYSCKDYCEICFPQNHGLKNWDTVILFERYNIL